MMERKPGLFERTDRALGRIWSRVGGTIFLLIGLLALGSLVTSENLALATHWPGVLIASVFLLAAWACFRSKAGLLETLSETPERRK